jgi:hypothetical protein
MPSEPYIQAMQATAAPLTTDFAKVTVYWNPSPFPDLVTLVHSKIAAPEPRPEYIMLSPAEAEQLAMMLMAVVQLARKHKQQMQDGVSNA